MAALAPIPPRILKRILELDGWDVWLETDLNWVMGREADERWHTERDPEEPPMPITIPKPGQLVPLETLDRALHKARFDNATYFELLEKARAESESGAS